MSEAPIAGGQAVVLYYNSQSKQWVPAGQGPSRVDLYRHTTQNTYRVVARCLSDQSVVINSALYVNLEYRRATETFHQWQDSRYAYGLNFNNKDEANIFGTAMENAIRTINAASAAPAAPAPAPPAAPAEPKPPTVQPSPAPPSNRLSMSVPSTSLPPVPSAPSSQTASKKPTNPGFQTLPFKSQAGVPPPPPTSEPSYGGVPSNPPPSAPSSAPPPPPGPPSSGSSGSLADQLANARLKKAEVSAPEEEQSAPRQSIAGPQDMMGEMAARLAAKKKVADAAPPAPAPPAPAQNTATANTGDDEEDVPPPPPGGPPAVPRASVSIKPPQPAVTAKAPSFSPPVSGVKPKAAEPVVAAPPTIGKKSAITSEELANLKAELLADFRAELAQLKQEILEALRQH